MKRRLLFITYWSFDNIKTDGICKKICSQIDSFKNFGYDVDYTFVSGDYVYIQIGSRQVKLGKSFGPIKKILISRYLVKWMKRSSIAYENVYIRYCYADNQFLKLLKYLKANKKTKIILEIPTFPYDMEFSNDIKDRIGKFIDCKYREKMKEYVDRIVTFSNHEQIYGIKTIQCKNGVDFKKIQIAKYSEKEENVINLIAVAGLSKWHGYERLISGLGEYYKDGGTESVIFHVVGEGEEKKKYEQMVEHYRISQNVIFYGFKKGIELEKLYSSIDIAVSSLGLHRLGLQAAQTLKSKEYAAKGLPIISEVPVDDYPNDETSVLIVPGDESPINIKQVVEFYKKIKEYDINKLREKIRETAKKTADMECVMKPISDFYKI